MRIMSFNVLCGGVGQNEWMGRKKLVTERISQINPDTFGVQEAHKFWMKTLCKALPEYDYVGVGRDDGKDAGEFSPVFFKKDIYSAIDSGSFWLSETPKKPSKGWDGACTRICSWAVLEEKATGRRFAQVNTHLDHVGDIARTEGIKLVLAKIKEFDMPVICTGDFNTSEDSEPYKIMTGDIMGDAKYLAKESASGNTFNNFDAEGTKNDSPIDFIFVKRDAVEVCKYAIVTDEINGRQPSDHYAIYADADFI